MKPLIFIMALAASGCALAPTYVAPELEHMSHLTQHEPFSDHPTRYGANIAQVTAHWDQGLLYEELSEGINLNQHYDQSNSCGEIMGPREQFTAKIGYKIMVK